MKEKIVNCIKIADEINTSTINELRKLSQYTNKIPHLSIILVGENAASKIYINRKMEMAKKMNINSKLICFDADISQNELINEIKKINNDNTNGIIIQLPLPNHLNANSICNEISPNKDVDGLTAENVGKLNLNFDYNTFMQPCTALGVMEVLKYLDINLEGKKCAIVNRSNIVGKPLSAMLMKQNATVTILHTKSHNINKELLNADIILSATGQKKFINIQNVKNGAVVIDIGINRDESGIFGDADLLNVLENVEYITPVPNGIGRLTIAFLMHNVIKAFRIQNNLL